MRRLRTSKAATRTLGHQDTDDERPADRRLWGGARPRVPVTVVSGGGGAACACRTSARVAWEDVWRGPSRPCALQTTRSPASVRRLAHDDQHSEHHAEAMPGVKVPQEEQHRKAEQHEQMHICSPGKIFRRQGGQFFLTAISTV